ncbi:sensor histidine kinase [Inhella proteolytica]|uniref:histidine kinase n=1 Tax=Inhella proteolytica TaxID=2795029 RepID=A0A931IZC2_9BURK|nr:sensor histidine kinase [Inhella proteolytica]MBH9576579.1 sensor histidine kinase [Inhella proteolytica]
MNERVAPAAAGRPVSSLRGRLRRVLLVLLAGLCVQWWMADRMILHVGESEMTTRLQHDLDSLAGALQAQPHVRAVNFEHVALVYGQPGSGHYAVLRGAGWAVGSPSFGREPLFAPTGLASEARARIAGPYGQAVLLMVRRVQAGAVPVEIAVAEDLTELDAQLREFRLMFLAGSVLVLALTMAIQALEIRRALRAVDRARDGILQVAQGHTLVVPADAPAEIRPLLDEIGRLVRHVEQSLQKSRTAMGDLSHAVKTPLAGLQRLADDARIGAHPELQRLLREQIETITRRIERELKRARMAGDRRSGPGFRAHQELPALVELLRRIHHDKVLDIRWQAPAQVLPFDAEDLLEILGNLGDNACKWAASRVEITLTDRDGLCLTVADDGPGCPAELREALGARGLRADERLPGHGLGLAIVRDIAEAAGGRLELGQSATLGGLEARVQLPR